MQLGDVLIARFERRVSAAVRAWSEGRTVYLENGLEVPSRGHGFGHELVSHDVVEVL